MSLKDGNKRTCWDISSINEKKIIVLYEKNHEAIVDFHRKFITRIYPAGSRVDSSNYDPIIAFNSGA
jgi:phosphatidylinositol phospholipase C delta